MIREQNDCGGKKNLKLCAWLLKNMSKVICDWKMCQVLGEIRRYYKNRKENLKNQSVFILSIHFTSVCLSMAVKSTKARPIISKKL